MKRRTSTAFVDTLLNFLLILILLPHMVAEAKEDALPPPGNISIEISWPVEQDVDIDLWVQAPGDVPVGYSNKGGKIFNLLRDDLGTSTDIIEANYENSYSRGIPDGEYTVNVHYYRDVSGAGPIRVVIRGIYRNGDMHGELFTRRVLLKYVGQELTVIRWKMEDGKLVAGSFHSLPKPLRSQKVGR